MRLQKAIARINRLVAAGNANIVNRGDMAKLRKLKAEFAVLRLRYAHCRKQSQRQKR